MNKKILISFLVSALCVVLFLTSVNAYVDKYYFFRIKNGTIEKFDYDDTLANERMLSAYLLKNNPKGTYDGIIVGGSKARPLSPDIFKHYTGMNYLSCVADCGYMEYYEQIINYAIKEQDIKHVILHFSGRETFQKLVGDIKYRIPAVVQGKSELTDDVYYLFTNISDTLKDEETKKKTVKLSKLSSLNHRITSRNPQEDINKPFADYLGISDDEKQINSWIGEARIETAKLNGMYNYYGRMTSGVDGAKEEWTAGYVYDYYNSYDEDLYELFEEVPYLPYLESNLEVLRRIKNTCDEHGVKLDVMIGSVFMIERCKYEGQEYWNYLKQIADITDFYDFSYFCDINNNPYNFLNGTHNLDSLAWVMISSMNGYDPYNYGKYVTKGNVDEYIREREEAYYKCKLEYESTGTVWLKGLDDESNLSVLPKSFFDGM